MPPRNVCNYADKLQKIKMEAQASLHIVVTLIENSVTEETIDENTKTLSLTAEVYFGLPKHKSRKMKSSKPITFIIPTDYTILPSCPSYSVAPDKLQIILATSAVRILHSMNWHYQEP